jgi:hypothetical protein
VLEALKGRPEQGRHAQPHGSWILLFHGTWPKELSRMGLANYYIIIRASQ